MPSSILVVLYNCSAENSETIRSILRSNTNLSDTLLCIWNNGPESIQPSHSLIKKLSEKGITTKHIETPQNAPLSWIYNSFIKIFGAEKNVILDHDSTLSDDYLSYIASNNVPFLGMPIINSKGAPRSPLANGKFSAGPYRKGQRVISIGSGMIISREAAEHVQSAYGNVFDESFSLYGVDTSFFTRLYKLGLSYKLQSVPGFEHSLSRLEDESESVKEFRKTERSYDLGLMLRNYPSAIYLKPLTKLLALSIIRKKTSTISECLSALIAGHHKKCTNDSKQRFVEALEKQTTHEQH